MKKVILIICLFVPMVSMGQDSPSKWYHTAKLDLLMPTKVIYDYQISGSSFGDVELDSKLAARLLYSYNHWVIKDKFSAGLLAGVLFFPEPQLSLLELGGEFRISILKELNANMLLQLIYHQPFDGTKTKGGLEGNIGIELPVYAWGSNHVIVGIGIGGGIFDMKGTDYKSDKV